MEQAARMDMPARPDREARRDGVPLKTHRTTRTWLWWDAPASHAHYWISRL